MKNRPIFVQDYRGSRGKKEMVGTEKYPCYLLGWDFGKDFKSGEQIFSPYVGRTELKVSAIEYLCRRMSIKKFNLLYYVGDDGVFLRNISLNYELVAVEVVCDELVGNAYIASF